MELIGNTRRKEFPQGFASSGADYPRDIRVGPGRAQGIPMEDMFRHIPLCRGAAGDV